MDQLLGSRPGGLTTLKKNLAEDSVSAWIEMTRVGDAAAIEKIWSRYFESLTEYARFKLKDHLKLMADEEDIALSALNAMFGGFNNGRYSEVVNRDELWRLLTLIATRKARNHVKFENRKKRAVVRNLGNSAGVRDPVANSLPTKHLFDDPAFAVEFSETCRMVFAALPDERTRTVASMRLSGFTISEIAEHISVAPRTVERKLSLIRSIWKTVNRV